MSSKNVTRFCLVRHGETDWNATCRIQGNTDIDLNDTGRRQAELSGRALMDAGIKALYSSDLRRAWNTAAIIGRHLALEPRPLPQLRERNYGFFEGMTYTDARHKHPEAFARYEQRDRFYDFETGESLETMLARVSGALQQVLAAHPGETVAVVLHGGVLDVVWRFVSGMPLEHKRDFGIPNAGLNWICHDGQQWRIESWAQTQHLEYSGSQEDIVL